MSKESAIATVTAAPPVAQIPEGAPPAANPAADPAIPQSDAARFAALARKEAQNVKDREAFKKEVEAHQAEKTKIQAIQKQVQDFEALRATDPVAALKSIGFSETDIFNYMAAQEAKPEPTSEEKAVKAAEAAADARIKAFQDAEAKKAADAQTARDAQMVNGYKSEISKFVEANKDTFEYCAFHGKPAEDLAYEIIVEGLRESKGTELIDYKEALQMVEDFYEEQDKAMSTLKKRQPKDAPVAQDPATPVRTRTVTSGDPNYKPPTAITRTRTLTNDTGVTSGSKIPKNETHDQKRERLIAQIKATGLRKSAA